MPVLPDLCDYASLGGELVDDHAVEVTSTDLPSEADCRVRANVAAASRTQVRAWVQFYWNGAAIVIVAHDSVWGNDVGVIPAISRSSAGVYTIEWPATVSDEREETHNLNLRAGWGNATFDVRFPLVRRDPANPNKAIVLTYDVIGALVDVSNPLDVYML